MPYHKSCPLWPDRAEHFFRDRVFHERRQSGPHCVSTVLAMLTGAEPETFQNRINTQDPVSWSRALRGFGLKLAYCPADVRKLRFYLPELLALDDLFTLSYYTPAQAAQILADPNDSGWICGSHIVILHRSEILDPATGQRLRAGTHQCAEFHSKRIFRVVPVGHERGC